MASPLIIVRRADAAIKYLEIDSLSTFQKGDQRKEFIKRAQDALREVLTGADAAACVRLALHDAGTYDAVTKTGGLDGSIILSSEELSRPENASLKEVVEKLKKAKAKIDAGDATGAGPISWADTIYLAGRVSTQLKWSEIKVGRAETSSGGQMIATQFANPWPVEIGRMDAPVPGPLRVPSADASVESIREYLLTLGAKPGAGSGPFTPKPPFWDKPGFLVWTAAAENPEAEEERFVAALPDVYAGYKKSFDQSRRTVTRTDYEVDFAETYNKLTSLGAKFNKNAYLYRVPIQAIA